MSPPLEAIRQVTIYNIVANLYRILSVFGCFWYEPKEIIEVEFESGLCYFFLIFFNRVILENSRDYILKNSRGKNSRKKKKNSRGNPE